MYKTMDRPFFSRKNVIKLGFIHQFFVRRFLSAETKKKPIEHNAIWWSFLMSKLEVCISKMVCSFCVFHCVYLVCMLCSPLGFKQIAATKAWLCRRNCAWQIDSIHIEKIRQCSAFSTVDSKREQLNQAIVIIYANELDIYIEMKCRYTSFRLCIDFPFSFLNKVIFYEPIRCLRCHTIF